MRLKWVLGALALLLVLPVVGGLLFLWAFAGPAPLASPERGVVLDDVTLVEPGVGRRAHRRIVVDGGEISSISEAQGADRRR